MRWEELLSMEKVVAETNEWRHIPSNAYLEEGKALVSRVRAGSRDLKEVVREAVGLIGGVGRSLTPGDRVLLKANFNSADPYPASTDLDFLATVVELLRSEGITDLTIAERAGWPWMPTRDVLESLGVFALGRELNVPVVDLDEGPWMDVKLGPSANWWGAVAYPAALKQFDKIVYLPCMKHHFLAAFTMSLKLIVGLTHPKEMPYLHADFRMGKPEEPMYLKMIEMNLPLRPDLIIMDGRRGFVTEGPAKGEVAEPGMVLASADQIALDVEGVKLLQAYPRDNQLRMPVWDMPVIRRAIELGLGARSEEDYRVVGA